MPPTVPPTPPRRPAVPRLLAALAARLAPLALTTLAPGALLAQAVRAEIQPAALAAQGDVTAALVNARDERVVQRLVPPGGRLELRAPTDGTYRVALYRVGYQRVLSDPVTLAANAPVPTVRLAAPTARVSLAAVRVAERGACRSRLGPGTAGTGGAALLWEEVRKALDATVLATEEGAVDATTIAFDRELDPSGRPRRETRTTEQRRVREPYVTRPPEELVTEGFMRVRDSSLAVFAPDARVLLHPRFLATHCYGVRDDRPPQPGWVGLTFTPIEARGVSDVEGTLWVEPETGELRTLEFRYVNLPGVWQTLAGPLATAGGEVRFVRLPSGLWVVRAWHVRVPMPSARPVDRLALDQRRAVDRLWETGGELLDATRVLAGGAAAPEGGAVTRTVIAATLTVVDEGGRPLAGAEVSIDSGAAGLAARTDSAGMVRLPAIDAAVHALRVRAVGFVAVDTALDVPPEPDLALTVSLARTPPPGQGITLPTARVVARRPSGMQGFERRRRAGLGVYLTADELQKRKVRRITDAFHGIPGMQVNGGVVSMPRVGMGAMRALEGEPCLTAVFIDGVRAVSAAAPNDPVTGRSTNPGPGMASAENGGDGYLSAFTGLRPEDVAAIEVYRGLGVTPPEFAGGGTSACGVIAVWTKRGAGGVAP